MKEKYIEIYEECITRKGSSELLDWIKSTDFFEAPASTRFHLARPGGLVDHSVHVFERLSLLCEMEESPRFTPPDMETIAICGLLHDVCKANFYSVEMRNRKNEQGQWERYPFYVVNDQLPYGHGEKSVYIVSAFLKLKREEAIAIRWHMGGFDEAVKGGTFALNNAYEQFPLALMLHLADMEATYIDDADDE